MEKPKSFFDFPYKKRKNNTHTNILQKSPEAYKYFVHHRDILETRDKGGAKNYDEFYMFGRNQGLKKCFSKNNN